MGKERRFGRGAFFVDISEMAIRGNVLALSELKLHYSHNLHYVK
jgi:hypothetical protein